MAKPLKKALVRLERRSRSKIGPSECAPGSMNSHKCGADGHGRLSKSQIAMKSRNARS